MQPATRGDRIWDEEGRVLKIRERWNAKRIYVGHGQSRSSNDEGRYRTGDSNA